MGCYKNDLLLLVSPPRSRDIRLRWWVMGGMILGGIFLGWMVRPLEAAEGCPPSASRGQKKNPLLGLTWRKRRWEGVVQQRLRAGAYTYLQIAKKGHAPHWLVVMGQGQPRHQWFEAVTYGSRTSFYSRRLRKCFPTLHFGRIIRSQKKERMK